MNNILIEKMQHSEINEVVDILTDAFKTNPAYLLIFKKKKQFEMGLFWLFKSALLIHNQRRALTHVVKEIDSGKIIGTFTLVPPEGVNENISIYLKLGIPNFILKHGMNTLLRMLSMDSFNEKLLTKAMGTSEYYYLTMVVIKKEYRGTGVGSYALKCATQELISSEPTCKLLGLTTQLPENEVFYSRLGFSTLDEGYVEFKKDKYYNYNMKLNLTQN